jgi:hypothetical protein
LADQLEKSPIWRQEAATNWRSFLQNVMQAQRTDELSDDPLTQAELRKIRDEE